MPTMTLLALPDQAPDVPWPTKDWPAGSLPAGLKRGAFEALISEAFAEPASDLLGETHALLVVHGGLYRGCTGTQSWHSKAPVCSS